MKIELTCQYCNNLFTTDYKNRDKKFCNRSCYFGYAKKNNLLGKQKDDSVREKRNCVQCNVEFIERKKHNKTLCSDECRSIWSKKEENKKNRISKSKETLLSKYGVESFFDTKEFKSNYKKIFIEKYGVEHPMYDHNMVNKLKNTVKEKHLINLIPRLSDGNLTLLDEYLVNKSGNTSMVYNFQCNVCENIFSSTILGSGKIPICRKCHPIIKNSKLEEIVRYFLNKNNIKHIDNNRKILDGKEIDLYLPEFNLGIEINGNYYHSENAGEKDRNYHIDKMVLSNQKDIKLLQFFEDEVILKTDIVFSRLCSLLNLSKSIFGRKCQIREVNKKDSTLFLNENHLQGNCIDKHRFGLFYNNELVSLMTFGKKRKVLGNKNNIIDEYELIRFCNKINTTVVGGFSKLLNYFVKTFNPKKIETYADIRWSGLNSENTVYYKNGFTYLHQTPPNYWYIKNNCYLHRFHRFNFRKDLLVKEGFSNEKTEWSIMVEKGYDRIWDCGSLKFEINY
jgi:hypothetical protein